MTTEACGAWIARSRQYRHRGPSRLTSAMAAPEVPRLPAPPGNTLHKRRQPVRLAAP
jgi:hypothetical protein